MLECQQAFGHEGTRRREGCWERYNDDSRANEGLQFSPESSPGNYTLSGGVDWCNITPTRGRTVKGGGKGLRGKAEVRRGMRIQVTATDVVVEGVGEASLGARQYTEYSTERLEGERALNDTLKTGENMKRAKYSAPAVCSAQG